MPFSSYFNKYPTKKAPFMHAQLAEWQTSQPLKGLKILHHVPVVQNTLLKIACVQAAGAEVVVTNPHFLKADPIAVAALKEAGLRYVEDLTSLRGEVFDLYFDCGAELYQILGSPKKGAVELTGTGDTFYREQALNFPVVSIDRTFTKQFETLFGSAESANIAISQLTGMDVSKKSWLIFGFGKIGRGLAYYCVNQNAPLTVVDIDPQAWKLLNPLVLKQSQHKIMRV